MSCKVSVLVPVYNAHSFLIKCVESILSQTFSDFELILVDDGSIDDSGDACDLYALNDSRVRVFHQANNGISKTREFALQQATGEYVMWVDSDDWIETDMVAMMVQSADNNHSDIVGCNLDVIWKDTTWKVVSKRTTIEGYRRDMIASQWAVLWRHLFRRSFLIENDIHFPEGINNGEDYYFVSKSFLCAHRFSFVDKILYHYNRLNQASTMAIQSRSKIYQQIEATKLVEALIRENNVHHIYRSELQIRKYIAKECLLDISFWRWFCIFPEVNFLWLKAQLGKWKQKAFK